MPSRPQRRDTPGVVQCEPHRQSREGTLVVFVRLSRRPPAELLEVLREHGSYRRGPGGASGWHLTATQELIKQVHPLHEELARQLYAAARVIRKSPEAIPHPTGRRRGGGPTVDVVKVG